MTNNNEYMEGLIAKALLEEGAKVVINYAHNEKNAEETKKEAGDALVNILSVSQEL